MRWLNRIGILLIVLFMAQQWLLPNVKELLITEPGSGQLYDDARASNFYPLHEDKWLAFDIANQARIFRFYFHASLRNEDPDTPKKAKYELKPQHSYQVTYQWLAGNGDVLSSHEYNINTRVTPYITIMDSTSDSPKTKQVPLRFYDHPSNQPSLDQSLYLDPSIEPDAETLRFQVTEMDISINYIGIRSYLQHQRNPQDIDIAWQRMSRDKRDLISSPSVYPSFLVSGLERQNVMAKYWKPIGPIGVLDKDYRIETIYLRENTLPFPPDGEITPKGIFASPQHWATVRLVPSLIEIEGIKQSQTEKDSTAPEPESNQYKLQWLPYFKQGIRPLPNKAKFHWQGVNTKDNREWQETITNGEWQGKLKDGLLKVVPNLPGIFTVFKKVGDQWLDITPQPNRVRSYLCGPDMPIFYDLSSAKSLQSLKLTGRGFARNNEVSTTQSSTVNITLYKQGKKVLGQYAMTIDGNRNPYVHFDDSAKVDSQINESISRHFDITQSVESITVRCASPVLINASTRPFRHPINRNLPAESNPWLTYETREPAWFSLQPKDRDLLIVNKRYFSVLWYFEPVEVNPAIAEGRFTWKGLSVVEDNAYEKQIFTPVSKKEIRQQARSVSYRSVNSKQTFNFAGKNDQTSINSSAVYIRDTASPQRVEVWVDDKLSLRTTVAGKSGRVTLPAVKPGFHTLEFKSRNIKWYINNIASGSASHVIRSAYTLIRDKASSRKKAYPYSLTFNFEVENPPQAMSIWLYTPISTADLKCQVTVKARHLKSNQASHSFRDYHYKIASYDYPLSKVMQQKADALNGPIPLYVALNPDMPEQRGQAVLSCNKPNILASGGIISEGISSFYYFRERVDDP